MLSPAGLAAPDAALRRRVREHAIPLSGSRFLVPLAGGGTVEAEIAYPSVLGSHRFSDLGVPVLAGDPARAGRGRGARLLVAVRRGLFGADPGGTRIVAEPDARSVAPAKAFGGAGFCRWRDIRLAGRTAAPMVAERSPDA